jgi:hypothetical protein
MDTMLEQLTVFKLLATHQLHQQTKEMGSVWHEIFQNQPPQNAQTVTEHRSEHGKYAHQ